MQLLMLTHNFYLLFSEEFVVGFNVDFILVLEVEVSAVKIICGGFAVCDAEGNIADVYDAALGDPAVIVALNDTNLAFGVLESRTFTVALGDAAAEIWSKAYVVEKTTLLQQ